MIIAIWIITALLIGLWSLAGWGLLVLVNSGVQWLGDLKPLLDRIPYAAIIEQWIPGWQDLLVLAIELMQTALSWLGGAAPLLVWIAWGLGTLTLLIVAAALSLLVVLVRKNSPPAQPPQASAGPPLSGGAGSTTA